MKKNDFIGEDFSQRRIKNLEKIAEKGDSQMLFMLKLAEYEAIRGGCDRFKKETIKIFNEVVEKLAKKIGQFADKFEEIKKVSADKIDELLEMFRKMGN